MIKTEKAFLKEMRRMIRCVSEGKDPLHSPPRQEDYEVLAECINRGYLLSAGNFKGGNVVRSLDGSPHPMYNPNVVPLKGLSFLKPDRTRLRANIALVISFAALFVSILANSQAIVETIRSILDLLK